jgi:hypothetical protein
LDGVVKRFEEGEQGLQCLAGAEFEVNLKGIDWKDDTAESSPRIAPIVLPIRRDRSIDSRKGPCQFDFIDPRK